MATQSLPALFISHGSPMTALEPGAAGAFMKRLGPAIDAAFGRPRAILAVSAHTMTREPVLLAAKHHDAVHDFGGFDPALYRMQYNAPGDPALARRVAELLGSHHIPAHVVDEGGLDHGIWTPLRYLYPQADVPVVPLAWVPTWSPARQMAMGAAISVLGDEGVLVMASGSITHNLSLFMQGRPSMDAPEHGPSLEFREWFAHTAARRDWEALLNYRRQAPHAVDMHPTDEHLLPWFVAAGVGGVDAAPRRLHESAAYAYIGMDVYAFGHGATFLM